MVFPGRAFTCKSLSETRPAAGLCELLTGTASATACARSVPLPGIGSCSGHDMMVCHVKDSLTWAHVSLEPGAMREPHRDHV